MKLRSSARIEKGGHTHEDRIDGKGVGTDVEGRGFSLEGTKPSPVVLTSPPAGIVFHGLVHA